MPRRPRIKSEKGFYHIVLRGINHSLIFSEEADYKYFLDLLKKYSTENNCVPYAYALMGNHIHMLIRDYEDALSRYMKQLAGSYAIYFNKKYERSGNLFQGRFSNQNIEDDAYFLAAIRYIHQNPVKAGLVKKPEQYPWSSYKNFLGFNDGIITDKKFVLGMFGGSIKNFTDFNNQPNSYLVIKPGSKKISDDAILQILKTDFELIPSKFNEENFTKKQEVLRTLLRKNATKKQISRILGIPERTLYRMTI